jgi:flagellar motility protein MotE (MotC chaperone)
VARLPWIPLALVAAAASLTSRIDAVFAAGEQVRAVAVPASAVESRVGAAIASDLARRTREADSARQADLQAAMLEATEKRIDDKLDRLSAGARPVRALDRPLRRAGTAADGDVTLDGADPRIAALVKMYQAMRPKDAARIFERLDLAVQVDVASHMRERAAAAILAEMDPKAASALTMALAGQPVRAATEADAL